MRFRLLLWQCTISVTWQLLTTEGTSNSETAKKENSEGEKSLSYLDVAMDVIYKAKENIPKCPEVKPTESRMPDCASLFTAGLETSGVYQVWARSRVLEGKSLEVYCDMDTDGGGWTVIQRRGNYSRLSDYFFKNWASYKAGFGDIEKDFWIGNDNIFALSNQELSSIRFDLVDVHGEKRFALYDLFWVDDETHKYQIHIKDFSGDAGDSMSQHDGQGFTTRDQDNDRDGAKNCASVYKGGWWYNACHHANLNGLYLRGKHESFADGVEWHSWKGYKESLDATEIKLRPKNFRKKPTKESGNKTSKQTHLEEQTPIE